MSFRDNDPSQYLEQLMRFVEETGVEARPRLKRLKAKAGIPLASALELEESNPRGEDALLVEEIYDRFTARLSELAM